MTYYNVFMEVCSHSIFDPKTILLKLNGNICNMNCLYCSEIIKDFYKEKNTFNLNNILEIIDGLPRDTHIIFHGGEPTLSGKDNISSIINFIKKSEFIYKPAIQTNGYLDESWVDFFYENKDNLSLSISLDGNYQASIFRLFNKEKAFNKINEFLNLIDKRNIEFRCIATINSKSYDLIYDIIEYFSNFNNIKFLKLNPCFDIDNNGIKEYSITPLQYLKSLKDAFNYMIKYKTYKKFKLDPITDIIESFNNNKKEFNLKCNKFYSVYPDKSIMFCDAMHTDENAKSLFNSYPEYIEKEIEYCKSCNMLEICSGGCPSVRNMYRKYNEKLLEEYCQYRIEIKKYILSYINNC